MNMAIDVRRANAAVKNLKESGREPAPVKTGKVPSCVPLGEIELLVPVLMLVLDGRRENAGVWLAECPLPIPEPGNLEVE